MTSEPLDALAQPVSTPNPAPWDRWPTESVAAYNRFLVYRNLGPLRTLQSAYRTYVRATEGQGRQPPGQWTREMSAYQWRERAETWDTSQMALQGCRMMARLFTLSETLSEKALTAVQGRELESWGDICKVLAALAPMQRLAPFLASEFSAMRKEDLLHQMAHATEVVADESVPGDAGNHPLEADG